jgi:hypothetical protein
VAVCLLIAPTMLWTSSPAASSCILPGLLLDVFAFRSRCLCDGLHASTAAVSGGYCGLLRLSLGCCYGKLLWGGVGVAGVSRERVLALTLYGTCRCLVWLLWLVVFTCSWWGSVWGVTLEDTLCADTESVRAAT